MTQLTEEQQQRLKQIRERNIARRELLSVRGSYDLQTGIWDIDFLLNLLLDSDSQAAGDVAHGWFSGWPTVNGFYWLRGWRHYGDLPVNVDGDSFWMMFNLAGNHRTDLDDSEDVQFLGPITPYSAITAVTRMRDKCVEKVQARLAEVIAKAEYAHYTELADLNPRRAALEEVKTDIESLTLDPLEPERR